jgi:hypothetical protein
MDRLFDLYLPLEVWAEHELPLTGPLTGYVEWWDELARRHGSD